MRPDYPTEWDAPYEGAYGRREKALIDAASRRLDLPADYLREMLHREPSSHETPFDRLRVLTYDPVPTGEWSWCDWRPTVPDERGWWDSETGRNTRDRNTASRDEYGPQQPFGTPSLIGHYAATGRIPVVEGLTDWLVASYFRGADQPTVGAGGTGAIVPTVQRLVEAGIDPARLVVIVDHDKKQGARQGVLRVLRTLRREYPKVAYLRPAEPGWDICDGWRSHRGEWADLVCRSVEEARPGSGSAIAAPSGGTVIELRAAS